MVPNRDPLKSSKFSQLCENQCFVEKGSYLSHQKSAFFLFFLKRGLFFNEKVSEKGYLFILENDHTSPPFTDKWRDRDIG